MNRMELGGPTAWNISTLTSYNLSEFNVAGDAVPPQFEKPESLAADRNELDEQLEDDLKSLKADASEDNNNSSDNKGGEM